MAGRLLTALVALGCLVSSAQAGSHLSEMPDGATLPAWTDFCERLPTECAVDSAEPEMIRLTEETRELLDGVNRYVNRSIKAMVDQEHWGKIDQWDFPTDGRGDCEDYQLLKRKLLVEAGLPRRALRMTVVIGRAGEGHAVLTVRTRDADLILDNLTDAVLPWNETGYVFFTRESAHQVGWRFLEIERSAPVVALAAQ